MSPKRLRELRAELQRIPGDSYRKKHLYVLRTKLANLLEVCELLSTGLYHTTGCDIDKEVLENFSTDFHDGLPKQCRRRR